MLAFDRAYLSASLNQLSARFGTVFAALYAKRQLPASPWTSIFFRPNCGASETT